MSNLFKKNIILFIIYMCGYTLMDIYYFKQDIEWIYNLILAILFSILVSKLTTK